MLAQHAQSVGIIDHQPGAVPGAGLAQARDIGAVAIHAEHAIADHQRVIGPGARQLVLEVLDIAMMEATRANGSGAGGRQARAIEEAGVIEAIMEDLEAATGLARGARQCIDHAQIGHETGGEQQRAWPSGQLGQTSLQLVVGALVAID